MADSRKIFVETMKLIKDALDPEFEDTGIIDHIKVVIDDQPDGSLSTGKFEKRINSDRVFEIR